MNLKLFTLILFSISTVRASDTIRVGNLHEYAGACNNEGGTVGTKLLDNQKWMNLGFVLDRPLLDNHTLEDINNNNIYPLKESMIKDFNEAKANQTCLLILSYLVDHAHKISERNPEDKVQFTVHVHRRSSGITQINTLLIPMLEHYYELSLPLETLSDNPNDYRVKINFPNLVDVIFRNGYDPITYKDYEDSSFVLSLGLVMGLAPNMPSSTILLPEVFIPTDEQKLEIYQLKSYASTNHLIPLIQDIIRDEGRQSKVISLIESNICYQSPNPNKSYSSLNFLRKDEFHSPKVLQILTLWSPRNPDEIFRIRNQ